MRLDANVDFSGDKKIAWFRFWSNGPGFCLKNYLQLSEREGHTRYLPIWPGWNIVYMEQWE
jgi:hypothetical protein